MIGAATGDRGARMDGARGLESRCPGEAALARFVDGQLEFGEGSAIEAHLITCARCREAVAELRALILDLRGDPLRASDELWATGGATGAPDLAPLVLARAAQPPRRKSLLGPMAAGLSLAAALCLGIGLERWRAGTPGLVIDPGSDERGFQARGAAETIAPDRWVALRAFSVSDGAPTPRPLSDGDTLRGCDRLLFAYDNLGPAPYAHAALLGAWPGGRAEWLFPDGSGEAGTFAAEAGRGRELHEEVGLDEAGTGRSDGARGGGTRTLRLWAIFSARPIARDAVENAIAAAAAAPSSAGSDRLPLPGTGQHHLDLRVEDCPAR